MFLKNKNIIFKIRRSKVADYAALMTLIYNFQVMKNIWQNELKKTYFRMAIRNASKTNSIQFMASVTNKIVSSLFYNNAYWINQQT